MNLLNNKFYGYWSRIFSVDSDTIMKFVAGRSIRADALQIYLIQFLSLGVGLVGSIIVARTLGPTNKGVFDLFSLINSFIVELGSLGFGSGLLYYLANKGRSLQDVHGTGLFFSLSIGLLTAIVGFLGLNFWQLLFPGLNSLIIFLAFCLAPFLYYRSMWLSIMTGINQAVATYKVGMVFSVLSFISIVTLLNWKLLNALSIISLTAVLAILSATFSFWLLYRQAPNVKSNSYLMKESFKYGSIIYIGNIANILHFRIDQVMINYWLGPKAVGLYAVSVQWAEMLFILDSAIISAALYKISSASPNESYFLTKKLFKVQLLISSGSGLALAFLAHPLIHFLYGEDYDESSWPLILLVPGIIAWSVSKIKAGFLSYNMGKPGFVTKIAVVGSLLNIVLNYLFFTKTSVGIIGAAIASSLSYLTVAIFIINKSKSIGWINDHD